MSRCTRELMALMLAFFTATGAAWAQRAMQAPLTTPEWLVDLARDHALLRGGRSSAADVRMVRTYLEAAVRLDPNQVHAWELLYELAVLERDEKGIASAVNALLAADPLHERGFECWLLAGIRAAPNLEARVKWLESVESTSRPAWQRSMVLTSLASAALEQLDVARAERLIQQALELEPANLAAARLALDALLPEAPPADWLQAQLRVLRLSPLSSQTAWQVASILDAEAFSQDAARFFDYALTMHQRVYPATPIPGSFWLSLARNRAALGRLDEAVQYAERAASVDAKVAAESGFLLWYLHARRGDGLASRVKAQLLQRFAAIQDPAAAPPDDLAQAAWFHLTLDPIPDRALTLAQAARDRVPGDAFVQRVWGWALAANQRLDEARNVLNPLASRDAWAAIRLAAIALATGDIEAARTIVGGVEVRPQGGPVAAALESLERSIADPSVPFETSWQVVPQVPAPATAPTETPTTQPAMPQTPRPRTARAEAVAAVLSAFDERVFDYYREPARFVQFEVASVSRGPGVGEPWLADFSLTNRGPFVITLGPNAMLNPVIVLSLTMEGDQRRSFPGYTTVSLDRHRVLRPGETITVRRTLDVGPPRRASRDTPQQSQRVTLNAVLDGILGSDGTWRPGPTGQALSSPVYFNRQPLSADRATLSALFAAAQSNSVQRLRAIEAIVGLIAERQRADLKRLSYTPAEVPVERLRAALFEALQSSDVDLRIRALESLRNAGLDQAMLTAIEPSYSHGEWLVRMMALPLAARQGIGARAPIDRAAEDADTLVRAMALAIRATWDDAAAAAP